MKKFLRIFLFILIITLFFTSYVLATEVGNIVDNKIVIDEANKNRIENTTESNNSNSENLVTIYNDMVSNNEKVDTIKEAKVEKIDGIWRMVINGVIDYDYTGLGTNEFGTWLVENGEVTFKYTGTYTDETGTYILEESMVDTECTEVVKIDSGKW